jgi:hypothetical protein
MSLEHAVLTLRACLAPLASGTHGRSIHNARSGVGIEAVDRLDAALARVCALAERWSNAGATDTTLRRTAGVALLAALNREEEPR